MQLKRLEAYGFKSFADKVDIEFDKGITAIVGPNGSGKSNITDAIKWVLGEQNVRNLRGIKAEDIIFTGSASRKPMGVAEVSLVFDNDGTLPVDFQEVVITRRLFRNGDSEFYINKSRCRLKDISNLFADTGLGHDGMGIISQNRIDEVLNARPEERRLFFEEAAGITKYRNRKRESLRKLDDTDANLTRVSDIIGEIENQMEPLRLSAEKTEKYNALQGEYKQLQLTGLYHRYLKLKESISAQQLRLSESRDQELAADTSLKLIQSRKEQLDSRLLELERQLTSLATERSSVHDSVQESQKEIRVLEERNTNSIYNIRRLAEQRKSWEEDKAEAISEIERLEKEKQAKQQDQQLAAEEIEKLR
ncbi:MAG: chromosome segregation SMC family protein, partial [Selenomonadaceae bacterium]